MILELIILLLAIPTGYLIAYLARDELIYGREYFKVLVILSIIAGTWFFLTKNFAITWTSAFILTTALISLCESYDRKWTGVK